MKTRQAKRLVYLAIASAIFGGVHKTWAATPDTAHPATVQYAFTRMGQHPRRLLIDAINQAHRTLDVAIYDITEWNIVNAIVAAKERGVKVRIITDAHTSKNHDELEELQYMARYGIPIMINTHSGIMHLKVAIIDDKVVTTGSFNFTYSASTINDEVLVIIHDPRSAEQFEKVFNTMWNDHKNFTTWKD